MLNLKGKNLNVHGTKFDQVNLNGRIVGMTFVEKTN